MTTLLVMGLLTGSPSLSAQPRPETPPAATDNGRGPSAALADGERLERAGDDLGALGIYRSVHQRSPSAESQAHIAKALDRLGRYGEAYAAYAALLDRYGNQTSPDQRKLAESRLRALDELTGLVAFDHLTEQATVRIDGLPVAADDRSRPLRVNRGERRIEIQQANFTPKVLTVAIGGGMQRIDASLTPLSNNGSINVSATSTAAATLFVDGRSVGPLPQRVELTPGMHEITAVGPTVEARPVRLQVEARKSTDLGLNLLPRAAVFEIDPAASDAVLLVDQLPQGAGRQTITLQPGRHELELRRKGYRSQRLSIDAQPGQRQKLNAGKYEPAADTLPLTAIGAPGEPQRGPSPANPIATNPAEPSTTVSPDNHADPNKPGDPPSSPYTGIFGSFVVPIMLGGSSTHSYVDDCPAKTYGGACTTSAPRGGGLGLRLGYFYEWIGLEIMGAGAVDVSASELKLPPLPTITSSMQDAAGRNVFVRAGGMVGIGLRLAIPMQGLRISVGADYLYVYRKVIAIPDSFAGASLAYSTPGWFIDGGIQLGGTPGARFYLGAFVMIEQGYDLPLNRNLSAMGIDPTLVPKELTQMVVYRGQQVFYGPLLGIAFGH